MFDDLVEMFWHNAWANECLFAACGGLSGARLEAAVSGTFGAIRDTLLHIAGAQERYVAALSETMTRLYREREPFQSVAELRAS